MRIQPYIQLLRIKQWVKNAFVFAPFLFAQLPFGEYFPKVLLAFLAFCAISSAVYIINDIIDLEKDRLHPVKANRPLARGTILPIRAKYLAITMFLLAVLLATLTNIQLLWIILAYASNNMLYSFWLKHLQLLDVFSIAFGFMLRVFAGAVVLAVPVSLFLFLTVFFLTLFLGLGKRRYELLLFKDQDAAKQRQVLKQYSVYYLDQLMLMTATLTLVIYILYVLEHQGYALLATVPLVTFGLFRYFHLTHNLALGEPSDDLLADPTLLTTGALYIACIVLQLGRWF